MTLYEAAREYISLGWSIMPLVKSTKNPSIKWKELQKRQLTTDEIERYFKNEDAGIGLICGKLSGIVVVDLDLYKEHAKIINLDTPVKVRTGGGGLHGYFKFKLGTRNMVNENLAADIRAEGGYVVLPPSIHPNGSPYIWEIKEGLTLRDAIFQIPELSEGLLEWMGKNNLSDGDASKKFDIKQAVSLGEGSRNDTLYRASCSLLAKYNPEEALFLITNINKTYSPPLPDDEVKALFQSAIDFISIQDKKEVEKEEPVDVSKLKLISGDELIETLGQTIKKDEINKLLTFLTELSAYTDDSQINISFNAPSSTGKSFIPTEIAKLFPPEDVIEVGYCSPTAFFHDYGVFDKEKKGYVVDLSRKIIIFLDQPHDLLLQHLRPILSHDKKEIHLKITDKSQKAGLRTKNILLVGYPVVVFCTAGLRIDEQEATRFLLLSPEINQEKIRQAVLEKIKKEVDPGAYRQSLLDNPERVQLMERIRAIKEANIQSIKIPQQDLVIAKFMDRVKILKPRHQRDISRVINLVKTFALLNFPFRERDEEGIIANEPDINDAFMVWDEISESQELNLPPYVFNFYHDIIFPAYTKKNSELISGVKIGLNRQEISQEHYRIYGRFIPDWQLRQQIIPMLETAGLVYTEPDQDDRRKILVYPTAPLIISSSENNSESNGGVLEDEGDPPQAKLI